MLIVAAAFLQLEVSQCLLVARACAEVSGAESMHPSIASYELVETGVDQDERYARQAILLVADMAAGGITSSADAAERDGIAAADQGHDNPDLSAAERWSAAIPAVHEQVSSRHEHVPSHGSS